MPNVKKSSSTRRQSNVHNPITKKVEDDSNFKKHENKIARKRLGRESKRLAENKYLNWKEDNTRKQIASKRQ